MDERQDYDSPWKESLTYYLPHFFKFYFPKLYELIDWNKKFKFLDKELRKLDSESSIGNREADALIELYAKEAFKKNTPEPFWVLIHIEIQSQKDPNFAKRMFIYNYRIRDRFDTEVDSLAVLCDTNKSWRPQSYKSRGLISRQHFTFGMVKLEDFRGKIRKLERSTDPFALFTAAVLHNNITKPNQGKRRQAKFELVHWLLTAGLGRIEIQRLLRLVDWVMTLSPGQQEIFKHDVQKLEEETGMAYITSWERDGKEEGLKQGRAEVLAVAEAERIRAEQADKRAEEEAKRAEEANKRAEEEAKRADRLEQELRELKAKLEKD